MKFLKTFLGLFFALFIPLMLVVGIFIHPKTMTMWQSMMGAAFPIGSVLLVLSLGFAIISGMMDKQQGK